ncbi:alkaline phosphatase family protein [Sphingomonas sp. LB-2]|uniref:alkaline phosphatase family protein n=1 Tax=Sphingomonas caeni TaxID=2984949 RepID=UPI0022314926|nr:alkaline phosphatase family protein [Sphingomonas caeni]MCW3845851.1 alkaline phosphatase family protein [Sphingomonas caeni]
MKIIRTFAALFALAAATPALAQQTPPKLVVVVSVDQFSADLFAEYRTVFTGGFARLLTGAVFPSGYQSHAATETCPGHSTILTGARPARTGIVANDWIDFAAARGDKPNFMVYCAEDESLPGTSSSNYVVSDKHLKVPTLGEWMKLADPASRVVSVAGKDRAAVMMGGHKVDELWWFWDKSRSFQSYAGRAMPAAVTNANTALTTRLAQPQKPMPLPAFCIPRNRAFEAGSQTVGAGRFARKAVGEKDSLQPFKASPEFDDTVFSLATQLAGDMKLGQGKSTDLLIIGASATDYVGHSYGTEGSEMCIQMLALDQRLGRLFAALDKTGVDYEVVLTADHGGLDIPERNREHGATMAARTSLTDDGKEALLGVSRIGKQIGDTLGITGPILFGGIPGDVYINPALTRTQREAVQQEAIRILRQNPQVYDVYTREQIAATPSPKGPPETWTMLERARAALDPGRTGDLVVALRPRITPIAVPMQGYTATHGSFWDYDRRVPILFWRRGMTGFEHPLSVETVDIAPTLAATLGVRVPVEIDGRCLDLDAGPGTTCK